jgi:hypothetical protein
LYLYLYFFKIVSFNFCGSKTQTSCSKHFLSHSYNDIDNDTNQTYLSGVNYLKSWIFQVHVGINNLNIKENDTYSMGSMLKISPVNNQAELNMIQVTNYTSADYVFEQSLTKIRPNENSSYYRLSVKALTTRFINNFTNGSITQTFNSSGNYSLIFNMSTQSAMVNSKIYTVVVKPGKKIKKETYFLKFKNKMKKIL